jgi:hypothetical protein
MSRFSSSSQGGLPISILHSQEAAWSFPVAAVGGLTNSVTIQIPYGVMGLGLGGLTPAFVVLFNSIWGMVAVAVYRLLTDSDARRFRG